MAYKPLSQMSEEEIDALPEPARSAAWDEINRRIDEAKERRAFRDEWED